MPFDSTLLEPVDEKQRGFDPKLLEPADAVFPPDENIAPLFNRILASRNPPPDLPTPGLGKQIWQGLTKPVPFSEMKEDVMRPLPGVRPLESYEIKPTDSIPATVGKEAYNLAISIPNFIATPAGAATTLTGGTGGMIAKGAAAVFSAQAWQQAGEALLNLIPNWNKLSTPEKTKAIVDVGGNTIFGALMTKGGTPKVEPFQEPPIAGASLKMPKGAQPPEAPAATLTPPAPENAPTATPAVKTPHSEPATTPETVIPAASDPLPIPPDATASNPAQDLARYQELTASLKGKSLDEAQPIMAEIETIKNRNPDINKVAPPLPTPTEPPPAAPAQEGATSKAAAQVRMPDDLKNAWAGKLRRIGTIGKIKELEEGWNEEVSDPHQQHKLELLAERKAEILDERNRGDALQQFFDESSPEMQRKIDAHLEKLNANRKLTPEEQQFDDFLEQQISQRLNKSVVKPEANPDSALRAGEKPTSPPSPSSKPAQAQEGVDVGFHYGDLQAARDTMLNRMDAGRSTGHFGTGIYFFGAKDKARVRANRPLHTINLSGLNLAKPLPGDVFNLHDGLKDFNRVIFKSEPLNFDEPRFRAQQALFNLRLGLGLSKHPEYQVRSAMDKVAKLFSDKKNDGVRTPSTYLMQELGYDGIDVRGTRADNGDYGSVIFSKPTSPPSPSSKPAQAQEGVKEPVGLKPSTKKMFEDEIAKGTPTPIDKESQRKFKPDSPSLKNTPQGERSEPGEYNPRPAEVSVTQTDNGVSHFAEPKFQRGWKRHRFVYSVNGKGVAMLDVMEYPEQKQGDPYPHTSARPAAANIHSAYTIPEYQRKGIMQKLVLAADNFLPMPLKPDYLNTGEMRGMMGKMVGEQKPAPPPSPSVVKPEFLKAAKAAPKDTKNWPKATKPDHEVVFQPYGEQGRGFYQVPKKPSPSPVTAKVETPAKPRLVSKRGVAADARKFNDLLREHAERLGLAQGQTLSDLQMQPPGKTGLGSMGILGSKKIGDALAAVKKVAARRLGLNEDEMGNQSYLAQHLPKLQKLVEQKNNFDAATADEGASKLPVPVKDLEVGETITVDGEPVKVSTVNKNYVVLDDGRKFGRQEVDSGETLYVEGYEPKETPSNATADKLSLEQSRNATEADMPESELRRLFQIWHPKWTELTKQTDIAYRARAKGEKGAMKTAEYDALKAKQLEADDQLRMIEGLAGRLYRKFPLKDFVETPKEDLKLNAPESIDAQNARLASDKKAAELKAKQDAEMTKRAARLGGDLGSAGQGDLLGGADDELFSAKPPSSPKGEQPPKPGEIGVGPGTGAGPGSPTRTQGPDVGGVWKGGAGQDIYGVAARVRKARADAGQVAPVPTGQGISDVEAVKWGQELERNGADAEKSMQEFERTKAISFDSMALARGHGETLASAARIIESKGTDTPEYRAAQKALSAWDARSKAMQTEWHKIGMAQQGETDIDTGSFTGIARAVREVTGEDLTPTEVKTAKKIAAGVRQAERVVEPAKLNLETAIDNLTEDGKPRYSDYVLKVADNIVNKLKIRADTARVRLKDKWNSQFKMGIKPGAPLPLSMVKDLAEIGAYHAAKTTADFLKWSDLMVREFGENVRPYLKQVHDASLKLIDAEGDKHGANADAVKKAVKKTGGTKAPTDLGEQQKVFQDYKSGKPMTPMQVKTLWQRAKTEYIDDGETNMGDTVHKLADDLGLDSKDVLRGLSQTKQVKRIADDVWQKQRQARLLKQAAKRWIEHSQETWLQKVLPATAKTMFSMKVGLHGTVALGTHAPLVVATHPIVFANNFGKMYKLVSSPEYFEMQRSEMARRPNYTVAQRNGLVNDMNKMEDFNDPQLAQGFPKMAAWFKAQLDRVHLGKLQGMGTRGYSVLKILRQDLFDHEWDKLPESMKSDSMAKAIADSVNHITGVTKAGAGTLGKAASYALFAPKLEASRVAVMVADPVRAANSLSKLDNMTPAERWFVKNQFKEKAKIAAVGFGLLLANQQLNNLFGDKKKLNGVPAFLGGGGMNPMDSDFMKFRVGGMNFAWGSPFLTMARLPLRIYQIGAGSGGKTKYLIYPDESMYKTAGSYLRTQASPFLSPIISVITKGDYEDRPLPQIPGYGTPPPVPKRLAAQGVEPYTWPEFISDTMLPIPVEQAMNEVWHNSELAKNNKEANTLTKSFITAIVMGGTGGRLSDDWNNQQAKPAAGKLP